MSRFVQEELDLRLEPERELDENIGVIVEFAFRQAMESAASDVKNRHEGYGLLAEQFVNVNAALKMVKDSMTMLLKVLPVDDFKAMDAAGAIENSLTDLVKASLWMTAEAKRVSEDLYYKAGMVKTPLEEYQEAQEADTDGFEEAAAESIDTFDAGEEE